MARALRGAAVGDVRRVKLPGGDIEVEVVTITYPAAGNVTRTVSPSRSS